jgi:hypothetical protein
MPTSTFEWGASAVGRRITRLGLALLLSIAVAGPMPVSGADDFFDWPSELVSPGWYPSAVIRSDGSVHIVTVKYVESGPDTLVYRRRTTAGRWITLGTLPADNSVPSSLAIDAAGHAHIAYGLSVAGGYEIRYATNRFGSWQVVRLGIGTSPMLAADPLGEVHLLYVTSGREVAYATNRKGYWTLGKLPLATGGSLGPLAAGPTATGGSLDEVSNEVGPPPLPRSAGGRSSGATDGGAYGGVSRGTRVAAGSVPRLVLGTGPTIALDAANRVHVAYIRSDVPGLHYLTNASGRWVSTRLSTRGTDRYPGILATPGGKVDLLFSRVGTSPGVFHTTNLTGSWVTSPVAVGPAETYDFVRDPDGSLRAAIYRSDSDPALAGLYMAVRAGSSWTLTRRGYRAYGARLGVDGAGTVHLVTSTSGVFYSRSNDDRWSVSRLTEANDSRALVRVGAAGAVHAVYVRVGTADEQGIYYGTNSLGSWTTHRLTTGTEDQVAFDLDPAGFAHVVFARTGDIYYATNASGSWSEALLTGAMLPQAVECPSIAVDSAGKVRFAYSTGWADGTSIPYWTNVGGTWRRDTVPGLNDCPALAVDGTGTVHVVGSMIDVTGRRVRYLTTADEAVHWSAAVKLFHEALPSDLAVDGNGKAHVTIAYSENLLYLTNATGVWVTQLLDHPEVYGRYPIAAAGNGRVAIARPTDEGVLIHRKVGSAWMTTQMTTNGYDGYPALDLKSSGEVHVLFPRDRTGLIYAHD